MRISLLAFLACATPALAVDYRELRANFDDYLSRAPNVAPDPQAAARQAAEAAALATAQAAAEQIRQAFDAQQPKPPPLTKRKAPITSASVGAMDPPDLSPARNAKLVHGPAGPIRPAAPAGYVWLFVLDPTDFSLAPKDPEKLTREHRRQLESESILRVSERFPFLADRKDPRRSQFDHFLRDHADMPLFKTLFSLTRWPELAANECGRLNQWQSGP